MHIDIKTANGFMVVEIDAATVAQAKRMPCRGCGMPIFFGRTEMGRRMPISPQGDGTFVSHFADCPAAKKFRKADRTKCACRADRIYGNNAGAP
jgi:hypothetical protein